MKNATRKDNDMLRPGLPARVERCLPFGSQRRQLSFLRFASMILILSILISSGLVGCGPRTEELEAVDYTPLSGDDWKVSTPAEQGLDPMLVAELYYNAAKLPRLYGCWWSGMAI
jgi:hypothetical protein